MQAIVPDDRLSFVEEEDDVDDNKANITVTLSRSTLCIRCCWPPSVAVHEASTHIRNILSNLF